MTFPIRKPAWKLRGIVKITIPEVFPEMKPLGNIIIFPVPCHYSHSYDTIIMKIIVLKLFKSD